MRRIIDAKEPRRPDPIPYGLMAQVRDALGSAVARQIMQVITRLNDDAERLAEEKDALIRELFWRKVTGKINHMEVYVEADEGVDGWYWTLNSDSGFMIEPQPLREYRHRKTAMRAARRIVERINRKGIEICQKS